MNINLITNLENSDIEHAGQAAVQEDRREQLTFRPFDKSDSDYDAIVAIENANYPNTPFSAAEYRFYDEKWDPKCMHERVVAEWDGRIVGFATYGQPWWTFKEGKYFFFLQVHQEWQNGLVPAALLDAVTKRLQPHRPQQLITETREDLDYVVDLLQSRGYEATMRLPASRLDVQNFDAAPFAANAEMVRESGIRVDNMGIVASEDPDWKHKLWDLEWEILQDVPSPEPLSRMAFDAWQKFFLESPNFSMDGQTVARDGDKFIGMSGLWTSEADPKMLITGLTGVIRSHRRRGIATAIKVHGIKFAQEKGFEVINTDNEENNPMLDLNKQLGFREQAAVAFYEMKLEFEEPEEELLKIPL